MVALKPLWIDYTNWKGERRWREVEPTGIHYGVSQIHGECWMLLAIDIEKDARREFDMRSIHAMALQPPTTPTQDTQDNE